MTEPIGVIPNELRAQLEAPEVVVELGQPFPLFPVSITRAEIDDYIEKDASGLVSLITVLDPISGYCLPLSIQGVIADDGTFGIDVETRKLGKDLLTNKGKFRKRNVYPFIASLRLTIGTEHRKKEELIPQINHEVNGISFFLPNALDSVEEDEVERFEGRLFSITAENR
jgi:hypothetical protein